MHELGIMTGVIEAAEKAARDSGATRLLKVNLSIGEMTEAIEDALVFAWEALTEDDPSAKGAELTMIPSTPTEVSVADAKKVMRLIDRLEELEDLQNVYHTMDITDEIAEALEEE